MLATALLLAAMMTGEAQATDTPGLVRNAGASAPLAKRFATLFPIDGSSVAPARPQGDFSPGNRRAQHRPGPQDRQDTICGLTVITKSAEIDPRIIAPPNGQVTPAVRRVEPDVCQPVAPFRK